MIALVGIMLSILSNQYSLQVANEIAELSSQDVRSNARIEIYELSRILIKSVESVSINLKTLGASLTIGKENIDANKLLTTAQESTQDLTDGYYWLDSKGEVLSQSSTANLINYVGSNLSNTLFFSVPKNTGKAYYGNAIETTNEYQYLYVSVPIMDRDNSQNKSSFSGVIVAAINLAELGQFLQREISPDFFSNLGLIDRNGVILYTRNEQVVGKNYLASEFQSLIPQEIKESYNSILASSLSGKTGLYDLSYQGNITTIAYQPINIDGKYIWTLFLSTPHNLATDVGYLINQQQNFSTIVIFVIVSMALGIAFLVLSWNKRLEGAVKYRTLELKKANDSMFKSNRLLASANRQLEINDKMQKEFINVAAHELRTPIMPILGEAELIENQFQKKKENHLDIEQINVIIRNAKRLDRLAADILDVTRIEGRSLRLNKIEFDLNEIISQLVTEYNRNLKNDPSKSRVQLVYEKKSIIVKADKDRITQVISNLLNNAIKFTDHGTISIKLEFLENEARVTLKDNGKGIDVEILKRLFTKFASKSEQGTGLGLFISKSIVEAHGGRIWGMNSVEGKGSTFIFTLPLRTDDNLI
jgi:signal transduction histidine kinase